MGGKSQVVRLEERGPSDWLIAVRCCVKVMEMFPPETPEHRLQQALAAALDEYDNHPRSPS